jgi:hypothetical protein
MDVVIDPHRAAPLGSRCAVKRSYPRDILEQITFCGRVGT